MKLLEPEGMVNFFSEGDGNDMAIEMRIVELVKLNCPITVKFDNKDEVLLFAKTIMEDEQ